MSYTAAVRASSSSSSTMSMLSGFALATQTRAGARLVVWPAVRRRSASDAVKGQGCHRQTPVQLLFVQRTHIISMSMQVIWEHGHQAASQRLLSPSILMHAKCFHRSDPPGAEGTVTVPDAAPCFSSPTRRLPALPHCSASWSQCPYVCRSEHACA